MRRNNHFSNRGLGQRILSFILALAMVLTMSSFSSLGQSVVNAATTNARLYFELPGGTSATDWGVNIWGGATLTADTENTVDVSAAWGSGKIFPSLLTTGAPAGWAYVEVSGTVEGIQFVKADGTGYTGAIWNSQIAALGLENAYFSTTDSKWYKEKEKTNEIVAAELQNIFVVAGEAGLTGKGWSIAVDGNSENVMTVDSEDENKYSITYDNVAAGTYNYKILQDPDNKGWDLPWGTGTGAGGNRVLTLTVKSKVEMSIDLTDDTHDVAVTITPLEEETEKVDVAVSDQVKLVIGENTYDMDLYNKGLFEKNVSLEAGTYTAKVTVNGTEVGNSTEITLSEAKTVIYRFQNGKLEDSINNSKIGRPATIVGNFTGLNFKDDEGTAYVIPSWNPESETGALDYIGGGLYARTFKFDELAEDLEIADTGYKVAFDNTWDFSIGKDGGNIATVIPAGSTEFTVLVDEFAKVVYDSVNTEGITVGEKTYKPLTTRITLAGSMNGWGDSVQDAKNDFVQLSDTLFIKQIKLDVGIHNYKVIFDGKDWMDGDNRNVTVESANTIVTIVYNAQTGKLLDSVNDSTDLSVLLGMAEPAPEMKVVDNANGTTTFYAVGDDEDKVDLFYATKADAEAGKAFTKVNLGKIKKGSAKSDDIFLGDEALDIVYYYEIEGVKTLDESNEKVTINDVEYSNYKRAAFTGRGVNVPGTFPGKSWDAASNEMTYQGNGLYTYTFKDVPAANYEYKIAFGSWAENYGVGGLQDGSNYAVTVPSTQDVTIYYCDIKTHLSVTSLNYIFATVTLKGTGIEETELLDSGLTGIYSATVELAAGTYSDAKLEVTVNGETSDKTFDAFTLTEKKEVTFYYAPEYDIYYHDAIEWTSDEDVIKYDSKDTNYKSVFGAVSTEDKVVFSIDTDDQITAAKLFIKKNKVQAFDLKKNGAAVDHIQKWSTDDVTLDEIGEYDYFFVLYQGGAVKIYSDDDGYYGEGAVCALTEINPYDVIVYKKGYETPDWMKNAVIYQIFPDRFYNGDVSNDTAQTTSRGATDYEYVTDWYSLPENPSQEELLTLDEYDATGAFAGDSIWNNEIYGGDLKGIVDRIDYLKALGVSVIYLNPVFSSISSHRYDATDYSKIDPILGTEGDFDELVKVAEDNGMKVVLDGVFNHVSDDSVYFDRYYKFLTSKKFDGKIGAYPYWAYVYDLMAKDKKLTQAKAEAKAKDYFKKNYKVKDFSYTQWFDVYTTKLKDDNGEVVKDTIGLRKGKAVYGYEGWWGYDSMPVIMSTNGSEFQSGNWGETIIAGENSIGQYWIKKGIGGWRLDVANEVSDETWQEFRKSVKALDSDAVIIGEIWDDASEYLMGDMYDSVMNYVFRGAVTGFAMGENGNKATDTLEKLRERYPEEALYAMMNLVGSHDTTRLLSYLDGIKDDRAQTDVASAFPTYENTSDVAKKRQYLVSFLQYTYVGAPTVYYGDEIGMVGADDPDDRRGFTWGQGNKELVEWYANLAAIRNSYAALRTGSIAPIAMSKNDGKNLMGYVRKDSDDELIVLANNKNASVDYQIDLADLGVDATGVYTDVITGTTYTAAAGMLDVSVPGLSGLILTKNVKDININADALKVAYEEENVVKTNIKEVGVKIDFERAVYTGSEVIPEMTVRVGSSVLKEGRDYIFKCSENIEVGKAIIVLMGRGNYVGVYGTTFDIVAPAKPTITKLSSTADGTVISWNAVKGATNYQIYKKTGKGAWKLLKDISDNTVTTYTDKKAKTNGTKYQYKMYAVVKADKTVKSKVSATKTTYYVAGVTLSSVKAGKKAFTVNWKKNSKVSGYEISYSSNEDMSSAKKVTVKGAKKVSAKVSKLAAKKTYYVRIRGYKTVGGKKYYSAWSKVKSVKTNK